ncbi:MAG: hypothetical protein ACE5Q3_13195, partial [Alphaproteobacteria bacterium]
MVTRLRVPNGILAAGLGLAAGILLLPGILWAATVRVPTGGDGLARAISAAQAGDTLVLEPGV